jgi:hypothetical protein
MFIFKNIICKFTYSVPVYSITRQYAKKSAPPETIVPELFQNIDVNAAETSTGFMQFYLKTSPVPYLFIYVIANLTHVIGYGPTVRTWPMVTRCAEDQS